MMKYPKLILSIVLILVINTIQAATFYVSKNGSGTMDGSSSTNSLSNLGFTDKLNSAVTGDIFVLAPGTYYPKYDKSSKVPTDARFATFFINKGISIKSDGTGTVVLSGNVKDLSKATDNSYNVVTITKDLNYTTTYMLEDITISDGYGNGGSYYSWGGGIQVNENAQVKFKNIKLINNQCNAHGCGLFIHTNAKVQIEGANDFINNKRITTSDVWGGAIGVWTNGELQIKGGPNKFEGNTANHGGALHNSYSSKVYIENATFNNNEAASHGGAVHPYHYSETEVVNSTFTGNKSAYGGAVLAEYYAILKLRNVNMYNNFVTTWGGAIDNYQGSTILYDGGELKGNTASHGGAIHVHDNSPITTLSNLIIDGNTAGIHGGGINFYGGTSSITSCTITNNTVTDNDGYGGGIHNEAGSLVIRQSTISNNKANKGRGGGISIYSPIEIYNTKFENNTAQKKGGGIYGAYTGVVDSCIFRGNSVTNNDGYGGGISNESGTLTIRRSEFSTNTAGYGGALHYLATTKVLNSTLSGNTARIQGGGVYCGSSSWFINSTIVFNKVIANGNTGGGIYISTNPKIFNTLVSGNTSAGAVNDLSKLLYNNVNYSFSNIVGSDFFMIGNQNPLPIFNIATHLEANLAANGSTYCFTHALKGDDNPAYALGNSFVMTDPDPSLKYDQRTVLRQAPPSIGAYEGKAPTPIANDDYKEITDLNPLNYNVLANDFFPSSCVNSVVYITQATQGTATVQTDNTITFTPSSTFGGQAYIEYYFKCANGVESNKAKLFITLKNLPDNVIEAGCTGEPSATLWEIERRKVSTQRVHMLAQPFVGDIDGDGELEVVTVNGESGYNASNQIIILNNKLELKKTIPLNTKTTSQTTTPIVLLRLKPTDKNALIVITVGYSDNNAEVAPYRLRAYEPNGTMKWESQESYFTDAKNHPYSVALVAGDINNDGIPEILAGDRIFNAATGDLLATLPTGGRGLRYLNGNTSVRNNTYMPMLADLDGDGTLEVVAGNTTYKVKINSLTDYTQNTVTVLASMNALPDGFVSISDINLDGKPDVIVTSNNGAGLKVYAWEGRNNNLIGNVINLPSAFGGSRAFVGKIDTMDICPAILFTYGNAIEAHVYDTISKTFKQKWKQTTTDASGATTISMFDFNHDKVNELVYRDQDSLRIIDGIDGKNRVTFECYSQTHSEYPIIVDFDNDGHADILVSGSRTWDESKSGANIFWFSSPKGDWAPTRKVWNQHGYNVVHVNDDLTIPRLQFNPATVFAGLDNIIGTSDDLRPFNGFLMQQTTIDSKGVPLWLLPNAQIGNDLQYAYYTDGDSLKVSMEIRNDGDASLLSPVCVSVYKDEVLATNLITTKCYNQTIADGHSTIFSFIVEQASSFIKDPNDKIIIRLNDDGTKYPAQNVCDMVGSIVIQPLISIPVTQNDQLTVFKNESKTIDVTENDYTANCYQPTPEIIKTPVNGIAVFDGKKIKYTPKQDYIGLDSLVYRITCEANYSEAVVYITVLPVPDNISEAGCFVKPEGKKWGIREMPTSNVIYNAGQPPLVGDMDGDGIPEILVSRTQETPNRVDILSSDGLTIKKSIYTPKSYAGALSLAAIGRIRYTEKSDTNIIITLSNETQLLYAYDINGNRLWESDAPYADVNTGAAVSLADIDGDGWAELIVANKVFAAESGKLLYSVVNGNVGISHSWDGGVFNLYQSGVGDVLGIGQQQVFAGNSVYNIKITNRKGTTGNSLLSITTIIPKVFDGSVAPLDGCAQAADIDLDGKLDIIVSTVNRTEKICYIYVWSPTKREVIASTKIPNVYKKSMPFIGDIDGDGYPEIVIIHGKDVGNQLNISTDKITALKYNPLSTNKKLDTFWQIGHEDTSGATPITLFDFNQDNIAELVYRDEKRLRIINGSKKSHITGDDTIVYDLASFDCGSATTFEYPVIADVDADGQAEIIIVGSKPAAMSLDGYLRIYKSNTTTWAPARKVWNQHAYNAVNINEDLTVPRFQLSPATIFPGEDGILGTSDDVRPYNAFIQQQTILNKNGTPLFLTPNAEWNSDPTFNYFTAGDLLTVSVDVKNTGDASWGSPIYTTVYKNTISESNVIGVGKYDGSITKGESRNFSFSIPNFSTYLPIQDLIIRINDSINTGESKKDFPFQPECILDDNSRNQSFDAFPKVQSIYTKVIACDSIDISLNTIGLNIKKSPQFGEFKAIDPNTVRYKDTAPCDPFMKDTLVYEICGNNVCVEGPIMVAILPRPEILLTDSCSFHPKLTLSYQYNAKYTWLYSEDNGSTWVTPDPDSNEAEINIYKQGLYKVIIQLENQVIEIEPRKFVIVKTSNISDAIWYESTLE